MLVEPTDIASTAFELTTRSEERLFQTESRSSFGQLSHCYYARSRATSAACSRGCDSAAMVSLRIDSSGRMGPAGASALVMDLGRLESRFGC